MKKLLSFALLALVGFASPAAFALDAGAPTPLAIEAPLWGCGLEFRGEGSGLQVLIGSFRSEAVGELHCQNRVGEVYHRQVALTMQTAPLSPTVGFGSFEFVGGAANITLLNHHPRELYGEYVVAQGRAAVIGGAGAFTAFRVGRRDISLQISTQLVRGFGVEAGISNLLIERM